MGLKRMSTALAFSLKFLHKVKNYGSVRDKHLLNTRDDCQSHKPEPEEKVNLLVDDVHLGIMLTQKASNFSKKLLEKVWLIGADRKNTESVMSLDCPCWTVLVERALCHLRVCSDISSSAIIIKIMTTFGNTMAIGSVRSSNSSCIIPQTCG